MRQVSYPEPRIARPFGRRHIDDMRVHAREVRRLFDAPGIPYHDDASLLPEQRFYRWGVHNPPVLVAYHHAVRLLRCAEGWAGCRLKPSYAFLSMYGDMGQCPKHLDRPQCEVTVDVMLDHDATSKLWPLHVDNSTLRLHIGDAAVYSGTTQYHRRQRLHIESDGTYATLAFFHFVPIAFCGPLS